MGPQRKYAVIPQNCEEQHRNKNEQGKFSKHPFPAIRQRGDQIKQDDQCEVRIYYLNPRPGKREQLRRSENRPGQLHIFPDLVKECLYGIKS